MKCTVSKVNAQLQRMDGFIEMLVTGLTDAALLDCVNLIVLADHGMAAGGPSFVIKLEDYIPDVYDAAYTYTGAFTRIEPKDQSDGNINTILLYCAVVAFKLYHSLYTGSFYTPTHSPSTQFFTPSSS